MFENLVPQQYRLSDGSAVSYFVSTNLPLVKLDLTFEAGSCYQPKKCLAAAANQLMCKASQHHNADEVAEFLDFRGIIIERSVDVCTGVITVYFLRSYAEELFPLLRELMDAPEVSDQAFAAHVAKRRMQLQSGQQKTSVRARNAFYEALYGPAHPLGSSAVPEDVDRLCIDDVRQFMRDYYSLSDAGIVLGGDVDEALLALADRYFGGRKESRNHGDAKLQKGGDMQAGRPAICIDMPQAVQSSIRVGRVMPFSWESEACARFSVLNTLLGGYFGSRLMTNLREDKGYTYGIYSQMQIFRGSILFFITAEVAAQSTQEALHEIMAEIERLRSERVEADELSRVCSYMRGDFLRSIDGVFEISERYRQMVATDCDERFTQRYFEALDTVTPQQLQQLAQELLAPEQLLAVVAGPAAC